MHIREIIRTGAVGRWHIVRTHREQNIAEHMYLATMIARDMAARLNFNTEQIHLLTDWVLMHDVPEVMTGDLSSPTKLEIKRHIDFAVIEDSTSLEYARLRARIHGTAIEVLAKLADLMEGIVFLRMEGVRVDDPTTQTHHVLRGCTIAYRSAVTKAQTAHPEYPWHLLYDYREELDESPVRDLRSVGAAGRNPA